MMYNYCDDCVRDDDYWKNVVGCICAQRNLQCNLKYYCLQLNRFERISLIFVSHDCKMVKNHEYDFIGNVQDKG